MELVHFLSYLYKKNWEECELVVSQKGEVAEIVALSGTLHFSGTCEFDSFHK